MVLSVAMFCQCFLFGKKAKGPDKPAEAAVAVPVASDGSGGAVPAALPPAAAGNGADKEQKTAKAEPERELTPKELKDRNRELEERVSELKDLNNNLKKNQEKLESDGERGKRESDNIKNTVAELERVIADHKGQNERLLKEKEQVKRQSETYQQQVDGITAMYRDGKSFDDLAKSLTKQVAERDMRLFEENSKEKKVLTNLRVYFIAKELLESKYDANKIREAQDRLGKITESSELLEALVEDVGRYRDCVESLKKAIDSILVVDGQRKSMRVAELQESKFNIIAGIVGKYMAKNYDYVKFPYLSDIVSKIMQRKGINADADIGDLQKRLQ
jgi:DNA repair exonuclease SbcCD ATPase subunit